jgi:hypothetical protein
MWSWLGFGNENRFGFVNEVTSRNWIESMCDLNAFQFYAIEAHRWRPLHLPRSLSVQTILSSKEIIWSQNQAIIPNSSTIIQ